MAFAKLRALATKGGGGGSSSVSPPPKATVSGPIRVKKAMGYDPDLGFYGLSPEWEAQINSNGITKDDIKQQEHSAIILKCLEFQEGYHKGTANAPPVALGAATATTTSAASGSPAGSRKSVRPPRPIIAANMPQPPNKSLPSVPPGTKTHPPKALPAVPAGGTAGAASAGPPPPAKPAPILRQPPTSQRPAPRPREKSAQIGRAHV